MLFSFNDKCDIIEKLRQNKAVITQLLPTIFTHLLVYINLLRNMISTYSYISLFFLLVMLHSVDCVAQPTSPRNRVSFGQSVGMNKDTTFLDVDQDIAVQLMPFDDLVRIAAAYSPLIKYQAEVSNSLSSARSLSKVQILQNASAFANYSGGNQTLLTRGVNQPGDPLGQLANGYRAGVDLRVSLYDIFGRKHLLKQADANYRASLVQKDILELQLRQQMIGIYQDMITAQQVLKYRLMDEQSALASLRITEAENQKGRVTSEVFALATNRYIESKVATEQVKGDFLKNVHQFESLVGVPIQRMKRF
jgi:outer membrane protein TolC